ncbi:MAG: PepSY-associated TM helix domain-containing protein [Chthoniobacter sp.]|uniref:PepSY-associated TM helix domain-containing protein n=1 Tax=Chthoniobacter sp. TaxID=2510640 RepID=UPI0032A35A1B
MKLHKPLLWIHLVTGLAAAIVLLLLGATGALLVFENEIDHTLNAALFRVHPLRWEPLPLDELVQKVENARPGSRVGSLNLPAENDIAYVLTLKQPPGKPLGVTVNPYTGEVIGTLDSANPFMRKVHQFHKNLLLGPPGSQVMAWGAILLVVLALTGLVLWWPRKLWSLGGAKATGRRSFDWHNFFGFYSSIFMLIFGVTGIVIHWDAEAMHLAGRLSGQPTTLPVPKVSPAAPGAKPLTAGAAFTAATNAVPGATITSIQGLGSMNAPLRITMRFPEDRTPAGRTNVYLHPTTGAVLLAQSSRNAPAPYRIVKLWNRQLHTGDTFGWPSRIIAALASASLPLLTITGPLIWWSRLRRRRSVVT